jgi:hypothetical protein
MLRKEQRKAIAKAKANPIKHNMIKEPEKLPDVTVRVLAGDVVRRRNAHVRNIKGQMVPCEFKRYTVLEVDPSYRWFRIEGDTKWHNANKFVVLEKADSPLQQVVKKVLNQDSDSANTSDTDSE